MACSWTDHADRTLEPPLALPLRRWPLPLRGRRLKVCAEPGCPELSEQSHCPAHRREPWRGRHDRRGRKTSGWKEQARARRVIRNHGGICHVCGQPGATEADHVIPLAEGGADDESNMLPVHPSPCHRRKTAAEAQRGIDRRRAAANGDQQSEPGWGGTARPTRQGPPGSDASLPHESRDPHRIGSPRLN